MSNDRDETGCRVCGRSALPHASHACRSCRKGKPETWVAPVPAKQAAKTSPVLDASERGELRRKSWLELSKAAWKDKRRKP